MKRHIERGRGRRAWEGGGGKEGRGEWGRLQASGTSNTNEHTGHVSLGCSVTGPALIPRRLLDHSQGTIMLFVPCRFGRDLSRW